MESQFDWEHFSFEIHLEMPTHLSPKVLVNQN